MDFLVKFKAEIRDELERIIRFWKKNTLDDTYGGFIGRITADGTKDFAADKGLVLNARILWTFSTVYNFQRDEEALQLANRAFHYLITFFYDSEQEGFYWSVSHEGKPTNTRKQIYGLGFVIYALSEYYKATLDSKALELARSTFNSIEKYGFDNVNGGYFEAFSRNWTMLEDVRLSEKDRNDPKTMNTHLHIIEGYANLYSVWKNEHLANKIRLLATNFEKNILNTATTHLGLFFSEDWQLQAPLISFGHDIEASWLLLACINELHDTKLTTKFVELAVKIAKAANEGLAPDGSLYHEYNPSTNHYDTHREWWVSAEAMVGYLNVFLLTQNQSELHKIEQLWGFTKKHLLDYTNGEWRWGVYQDYTPMYTEDLVGFWKCPYHNTRACIELLKRLD